MWLTEKVFNLHCNHDCDEHSKDDPGYGAIHFKYYSMKIKITQAG